MTRLHQSGPKRLGTSVLLLFFVLSGLVLRVWHINFDQGLGTHPDERSTACFYGPSIHLPQSWDEFWDPHNALNPLWNAAEQKSRGYTYGHFPLYLGLAMGEVMHLVAPLAEKVGAPEAATTLMARANEACDGIAVAGRLVIALLDTATIVLLFVLGMRVYGPGAGLIVAGFYAYTAQAIQLSHFFAMDPASTTFTVLALLGAVLMVQKRSWGAALLTGAGAGMAIASKFSALPILLTPFVAVVLIILREQWQSQAATRKPDTRTQFGAIRGLLIALVTAAIVFFITSPYAVLDWQTFIDATLIGQGRMVRGIADMPFTRQYRNTTPYLYFLEQQLRWGLWWPLGLVAALGTMYSLALLLYSLLLLLINWVITALGRAGRALSDHQIYTLLLWSWVLPYFGLTGGFLAKFNRYMSPILPFVLLFAAGLIWHLWHGFQTKPRPSPENSETPTPPSSPHPVILSFVTRPLAVLLTLIGMGGGLFWSLAYVNGVYNREHTWITASRWIYQNAPRGSILLWEQWDDPLPKSIPGEPGMDMGTTGLRNIDWGPYEEDTAEKYTILKEKLREANYVVYSSKRIYDSVDELPERYPMTNRYYQAMWSGELGFKLVQEVTSPPQLLGFVFDDRHADESWSLYDHAQVSIFQKTRDLSDAEYDAVFQGLWEQAVPWYRGKDSVLSPLLNALGLGSSEDSANRGVINRVLALATGEKGPELPLEERRSLLLDRPLAELPVVDNYRWNTLASTNRAVGIVWWWLVVTLLGWAAWPLAFALCRPLRDRGYLISRALGWLLGGWLLWWLASLHLAVNSVSNAWLTVAVVALLGAAALVAQWGEFARFLRRQWPMLLAGEALFAIAYLFFVFIRMGNPDLWQPWFGGEKFMEYAILNGSLRSPYFPPMDPHFAGGFINYYYFGLYLVAYLIKLTGIYAEVAFNLAIPTLFALTVVNAFAVAYSAVWRGELRIANCEEERTEGRRQKTEDRGQGAGVDVVAESAFESPSLPVSQSPNHLVTLSPVHPVIPWKTGFLAALLAPLFVTVIGNLDGAAQVVRNLARLSSSGFQSSFGLLQITVQAASGLRMVVSNPQAMPGYDFWGPSRVIPDTINEFPYWSFLFADLHPHLIGIPFGALFLTLIYVLLSEELHGWRAWLRGVSLLFLFALLLGAMASVNLWELPTYFGLGLLAFVVSQYARTGRVNAPLTLVVALAYMAGAYLLFLPFFRSYVNVGASGVGLVHGGDALGDWLLIWGFLGFILVSWLVYAAGEPWTQRAPAATASAAGSAGTERWLGLAARQFDRLPRMIYLHNILVEQPSLGYLCSLAILPLALAGSLGALVWERSVLTFCLFPLGLAALLLWRRRASADPASQLIAILTFTGLAILVGTQIIYLKDFLQGGGAYRMNTLFKFFNQVWVLWGVAAAIALPRFWRGFIANRAVTNHYILRMIWSVVFVLLLAASLGYLIWGTPARLDQRFPGWRPPYGSLNGLDFMRQGVFYWPDQNNPIELSYDWEAIQWLLAHVRGNVVIVESSQIAYYREMGSRVASLTGLSGLNGMHESEQRYGELVGQRDALLHEFWSTPDLGRIQQLIDELQISLIYVGQLERFVNPDGVRNVEQMAANGTLELLFKNDRVQIYAVPGRLAVGEDGVYHPFTPS